MDLRSRRREATSLSALSDIYRIAGIPPIPVWTVSL